MAGVVARQGIEQTGDILGRDRPEAQPALRGVALRGLVGQCLGHLIGARCPGQRITGDAQAQHALTSSRQLATSARRRSGVTRAWSWPSSSNAGEQAQAPRQYTGRRSSAPSSLRP
ncbi:hypothetical protein WR25_06587 [Diploscapter pachys]|uniref:Uncharacterized protein n=1 Tax=Diploscapter pachys TaxID=2018661 RepID=A0A2A2M4V7_9BILA|nr:hypothetical protein WR25_06587 [Diploscapter pachys]